MLETTLKRVFGENPYLKNALDWISFHRLLKKQ